jgi:putative DNA primase/helicase
VCSSDLGQISESDVENACAVVEWHLGEARRFFGELALPAELADASRLDSWLVRHCRENRTRHVAKNQVRQCGPGPLREKKRLDAALEELVARRRVRIEQEGGKAMIAVNPAIIQASS